MGRLVINESDRDITVAMHTRCGTTSGSRAFLITMKGATLDSQNMSSTIGDNKTVDLSFSCQVAGPGDEDNGVFMSGKDVGKEDLRG